MKNLSCLRRSFLAAALCVMAVQLAPAADDPADNQVFLVQEALKLKHFYYGDVDGNFDYATQGALRRFQFRNGLPGTGAMDDATVEALTGIPSFRKSASGNMAIQAERGPEIARPAGREDNGAAMNATPNDRQETRLSTGLSAGEGRPFPRAQYSVQVRSWAAEHRAPVEDRVEVRRAIPITTETSYREQFVPRSTSISPEDSTDNPGSREFVTTVIAHFSGQDGHVYTYYRKIRTRLPDEVSNTPTSPVGIGESSASYPREISDRTENRGGNIANR